MERTPRAKIKGVLRMLYVQSRERQAALKRDNYSCVRCGVKKSTAKGKEQKVEVHHKYGVDCWNDIIELIQDALLCDPEFLETLCPECHKKED